MNYEEEINSLKKEIADLKERLQRNSNNDITDIVDEVKANQTLYNRIMKDVHLMIQEKMHK
jgi:hypothetical protein